MYFIFLRWQSISLCTYLLLGMVDTFQKSYESLQVPYPKSTMDAAIEQQASQQKADYEKFVASSKARIDGNFRRKENMILGTQKHNFETYFFPPRFQWRGCQMASDEARGGYVLGRGLRQLPRGPQSQPWQALFLAPRPGLWRMEEVDEGEQGRGSLNRETKTKSVWRSLIIRSIKKNVYENLNFHVVI